jgi:galactose mutarotase-like enzyme
MPYQFTRTVRVTSEGVVEMRYAVRNDGSARMPFIWAAHPLLPLTPKTRIIVPQGTKVRVGAQQGIDIGGVGSVHEWPRAKSGEKTVDLSAPDGIAKKYMVKLFLELAEGRVAIEEEGARLELSYQTRDIPDLGLWINRRGWTGAPKRPAGLTIGVEPAIGAPDSLADALGSWKRAHWLAAGETREWTLSWRGSA